MKYPPNNVITIDGELCVPAAEVQLVHYNFTEPPDSMLHDDEMYRVELCLTSRPGNARACYRNRWSTHCFERIGNLFVVPPGEDLLVKSDYCGQQTGILCQLHAEHLRTLVDGDLEWTDRRLLASLDIRDANIQSLLLRLVEEVRYPGFASEMLVELIAGQMGIELGRYYTAITDSPMSGGLAPWRLRLIDERLKEVSKMPTLSELAELCQLSVRQMTRGFRASRGCSIGDYVANCRVEYAKQLLAAGHSIKFVAYSVDFSSPSSFCFAFRRATGLTPRQFRDSLLRTL